jgi:hypothetical protein
MSSEAQNSYHNERCTRKLKYAAEVLPSQESSNFKKWLAGSKPLLSELIRLPFHKTTGSADSKTWDTPITRYAFYVSEMTLVITGLAEDVECTPWSLIDELRIDIYEKTIMKLDSVKLHALLEIFKLKWSRIGEKMFIPIPFELCMGNNALVLKYMYYAETRVHVRLHDALKNVGDMNLETRYGYMLELPPHMKIDSTKGEWAEACATGPCVPVLQRMRTLMDIESIPTVSYGPNSNVPRIIYPIKGYNSTSAIFFYFTEKGMNVPITGLFKDANIHIGDHDMFEPQSQESIMHRTSSLLSIPGIYCIFDTGAVCGGEQHHTVMNIHDANDMELRITPSAALFEQHDKYELHMFSLNTLDCTYFEGVMRFSVSKQ